MGNWDRFLALDTTDYKPIFDVVVRCCWTEPNEPRNLNCLSGIYVSDGNSWARSVAFRLTAHNESIA